MGSGYLREVTSRRVSKRTRSSGVYRARKARLGRRPLEKEASVEKKKYDQCRVSKLALCLLITLQAVESAALTSPQWKRYLQLCSPLCHMLTLGYTRSKQDTQLIHEKKYIERDL